MITMVIGELCNLIAYSFTDAILVRSTYLEICFGRKLTLRS